MKNKKGHFDFLTLVIAVIGGVIAYAFAQKHLIKNILKEKNSVKNEKTLRFWK